jgi:hypothetical protein
MAFFNVLQQDNISGKLLPDLFRKIYKFKKKEISTYHNDHQESMNLLKMVGRNIQAKKGKPKHTSVK